MSAWITGPVQNGTTSVGTTAVPLSTGAIEFNRGVTICSLQTNTGVVYVGASNVTTANGFPLAAGQSVKIEASSPAACFVIASASSQEVRWLGA